jgi:hypothetical protein
LKELNMENHDTIIAVFEDHNGAEDGVRAPAILGIEKPSRLDVHTGAKQISAPRDVAAMTA